MPVVIKETLHKVTVDNLHMRLVQLSDLNYKMKRNDGGIEWTENNKARAIERFVDDVKVSTWMKIKRG